MCITSRTSTDFGQIAQNNGHYAIQGRSRSSIFVRIESPCATSYQWLTVTCILSRIVSKTPWSICQIFAVDRGCLSLSRSFGVNLFCCRETKTITLSYVKKNFDTLNRLGENHESDGRTDIIIANAALSYVTRPKMWKWVAFHCLLCSITIRKRNQSEDCTCKDTQVYA